MVTAGLGDIYASSMRGSPALLVSVTELFFGLILRIRAIASDKSVAAIGKGYFRGRVP